MKHLFPPSFWRQAVKQHKNWITVVTFPASPTVMFAIFFCSRCRKGWWTLPFKWRYFCSLFEDILQKIPPIDWSFFLQIHWSFSNSITQKNSQPNWITKNKWFKCLYGISAQQAGEVFIFIFFFPLEKVLLFYQEFYCQRKKKKAWLKNGKKNLITVNFNSRKKYIYFWRSWEFFFIHRLQENQHSFLCT